MFYLPDGEAFSSIIWNSFDWGIHLFIHLSVSVRMHRYMFYTLHLYPNSIVFLLLKLFQLWPLGTLSVDSCVPLILIYLIILYMCTYLYGSCWGESFMALQEVPGSSWIFPAPALYFWSLLQGSLVSFIRECYQKSTSQWLKCSDGNFKQCNLNSLIFMFCIPSSSYSVSYSAMTVKSLTKAPFSEFPY